MGFLEGRMESLLEEERPSSSEAETSDVSGNSSDD